MFTQRSYEEVDDLDGERSFLTEVDDLDRESLLTDSEEMTEEDDYKLKANLIYSGSGERDRHSSLQSPNAHITSTVIGCDYNIFSLDCPLGQRFLHMWYGSKPDRERCGADEDDEPDSFKYYRQHQEWEPDSEEVPIFEEEEDRERDEEEEEEEDDYIPPLEPAYTMSVVD